MGGGGQQETKQKMEPWGAAQGTLRRVLDESSDLFGNGGFAADPYSGPRVANPDKNTYDAQNMIRKQALSGQGASGQAQDYLSKMMSQGWQSDQLSAVKSEALGSAIPAAVSQFSGSGMTNSSAAQDTVGRAATAAIAPYEYDAFNNMQTNALRGAALTPSIDQAQYLPAQMLGQVGAQRQAQDQAEFDSRAQQYYEQQNQPMNNLMQYAGLAQGIGGMGGTSSATAPGPSGAQKVGGSVLGGLGTYGALAMNPVTAPFAIGGGALAGMMGLF